MKSLISLILPCVLLLVWLLPSAGLPVAAVGAEVPTRADRYGDPLPKGAVARLGTARLRHLDNIQSIVFSADGKMLAATDAPTVALWETATGKALGSFRSHAKHPVVRGFRDGGKVLLLVDGDADGDGWACVDARSGKLLHPPKGQGKGLGMIDVAADGKTMARVKDEVVRVIDLATDREIVQFPGKAEQFDILRFSNDGKLLAHKHAQGIRLLDVAAGKETVTLAGDTSELSGDGPRIVFAPDDKTVAVMRGKRVGLWDTVTGQVIRQLPAQEHNLSVIAFDGTGKHLLSVCSNRSDISRVRRWEMATGKETGQLKFPYMAWFAFSPDGQTVAVADDQHVKLWDVTTGKQILLTEAHPGPIVGLSWSPDGKQLASSGTDYRVWEVSSARQLFAIPSRQRDCDFRFSPDGKLLAVPDGSDYLEDAPMSIGLWDGAAGRELRRLLAGEQRVIRLAFSPDGLKLATAHMSPEVSPKTNTASNIWMWNVKTGKVLTKMPTGTWTTRSLAYSPDGQRLATAGFWVELWDAASGQKLQTLPVHFNSLRVGFSPDSRLLASMTTEGVSLWSVARAVKLYTLVPAGPFAHHAGPFAFTPDGHSVLVGGSDGTMALWDLATGKKVLEFAAHASNVTALAISADGRWLASGAQDSSILVWPLPELWHAKLGVPETDKRTIEAAKLWQELGSADPAVAYKAVWCLAAREESALELLRPAIAARLKERAALPAKVRRLVAELEDDQFDVRDAALKELRKIGGPAAFAVEQELLRAPSAELRRAAAAFFADLKSPEASDGALAGEALLIHRAIQLLELLPGKEAADLLDALASKLPGLREGAQAKFASQRRQQQQRKQ